MAEADPWVRKLRKGANAVNSEIVSILNSSKVFQPRPDTCQGTSDSNTQQATCLRARVSQLPTTAFKNQCKQFHNYLVQTSVQEHKVIQNQETQK